MSGYDSVLCDGDLKMMDWFCGAGGSSQGGHAVPGIFVGLAANHWTKAIESHQANFPNTKHYMGDISAAPVHRWPVSQIFWASPECTTWTQANGKIPNFKNEAQRTKWTEEEQRSRALMEEVPAYLRGVQDRGGLVLAGVVENVVDVRGWSDFDAWVGEFHKMGYRTRLIALNSMHVEPRALARVPQSRDRLYLAYWHESLGRTPDWDKWLRPHAHCWSCDQDVQLVQIMKYSKKKKRQNDMGRYGVKYGQYYYRCPNTSCQATVEPPVVPAYAAIDWSLSGTPVGSRKDPLEEKTLARIVAGLEKFARPCPPMLVPSGGTWRDAAASVLDPMATRTGSESDALAVVPPLLVPNEGRDGKTARPAHWPLRTQSGRQETGLAVMPFQPFITPMRGGGDAKKAYLTTAVPLHSVTAGGNHHGLATPPGFSNEEWQAILAPYYSNGRARPISEPIGAITGTDRWALAQQYAGQVDINDVLYRMLEPHEIGLGMAFGADYVVIGSKRQRVKQYGNAVTPPAAEILLCALVEAVNGVELDRFSLAA